VDFISNRRTAILVYVMSFNKSIKIKSPKNKINRPEIKSIFLKDHLWSSFSICSSVHIKTTTIYPIR
jgi:hypothetical protein